jgi:hypothetical protein
MVLLTGGFFFGTGAAATDENTNKIMSINCKERENGVFMMFSFLDKNEKMHQTLLT